MNYLEGMKLRDIVENSTWLRDDNNEMLIILSLESDIISQIEWLRIVRISVNGRLHAGIDNVFVPLLFGQIDRGILKKIS